MPTLSRAEIGQLKLSDLTGDPTTVHSLGPDVDRAKK